MIRYRDLETCGREDLCGAIEKYVGSIVRARQLAGVPHPARDPISFERWDEDRVLEEILDRSASGEPLAYSKVPTKLTGAARRYFGSWEDAITAAGFDSTRSGSGAGPTMSGRWSRVSGCSRNSTPT